MPEMRAPNKELTTPEWSQIIDLYPVQTNHPANNVAGVVDCVSNAGNVLLFV